MKTTLNNRTVHIQDIDGIDSRDYPDFCDAFIASAYWADTEEELTEAELDVLNENGALVYEAVMEYLY